MQSSQRQQISEVHVEQIDEGIVDDQSHDVDKRDNGKSWHSQLAVLSADEVDKALGLTGNYFYTLRQLSDNKFIHSTEKVTLTVVGQPKKAVRARNPKEIEKLRKNSPNSIGSSIGSVNVKISSTARVTGALLALLVDPSSVDGLHQVSLYRMISPPGGKCIEQGFYEESMELKAGEEKLVKLQNIGLIVDTKIDQLASFDKLAITLRNMHHDPRLRPLFENLQPNSTLKAPLRVDPMNTAESCKFRMFFTFVPEDDGKDWEIGCCLSNPVESKTGSDGGKSDLYVVDSNPNSIPLNKIHDSLNTWIPKEDLWVDLNRKIGSAESLTAELIVDSTAGEEDSQHMELELILKVTDSRVKLHLTKMEPKYNPWSFMHDDKYDAKILLTYKKKCSSSGENKAADTNELACELPIRFYFLQRDEPVRKKPRQEQASIVLP